MVRRIRHVSLTRFLMLSFGLHGLLLLGPGKPLVTAATHYLGQPVVNVVIQDSMRAARAESKTASTSLPPGNDAGDVSPASGDERYVAGSSRASSLAQDAAPEHEPGIMAAPETALRNQLLGELQTRLSRYLVYPPLARERGWEGTVLLGLRVESDGHIEKVRIEHSSGYAVLDRSALNSLNRLAHLAGASDWLNGRGFDMQLPVIYRLIEN
ncbi:MAG: energy transducer TonB [Sulfuricaulis sp.]|nr:energy transducer TonB [Sulfuricaulis sp.]